MKTTKLIAASAAAVGLAMTSHAALADASSHFTAKGTMTDGAKVSGSVYIDTANGNVTSASLAIGAPDGFTQTSIVGQGENLFGFGNYGIDIRNAAATEDIDLDFVALNIIDYRGGSLIGNLFNLSTSTAGPGVASLKLYADSIKKFYASGTLQDGAKIGGYLTINRTLGTIVRSALSFASPDYTTQVNIVDQGLNDVGPGVYGAGLRNFASTKDFNFDFASASLVNFNGGALTAGNLYNLTTHTFGSAIQSMTLGTTLPPAGIRGVFAPSPAPEPTARAMMLMGLCGLGAAMRSRGRAALLA